jgi:outer membrane biosynthesis protein TonB
MASSAVIRPEERLPLGVAVVLHGLLLAVLLLQPDRHNVVPVPERMTVSLAEDVGLKATAPAISTEQRVATAPVLAPEPAPPTPPEPVPVPEPAPKPDLAPAPKPSQPAPQKPTPKPSPTSKPVTKPSPAAQKPVAKPAPSASQPAPVAKSTSAAKPAPAEKPAAKPGGASRIGSDFLSGAATGSKQGDDRIPASEIGTAEKASLAQAIGRQLKPHWSSPQGADAELLVTVLAFNLNPDGTLAGTPRVVRQEGITDANRPQAARHAELAVRAVQLAAPFDLPPKFYNAWKQVSAFRFDRKLSQ